MKILINLVTISKFDSQLLYSVSIISHMVKNSENVKFTIVCNKSLEVLLKNHLSVDIITIPDSKSWFMKIFYIHSFVPFIFWKNSFNFIYNPTPFFPLFLYKYSIITIHDLAYLLYKKEEGRINSFFVSIFYFFAKYCKLIITISQSVKNELIQKNFPEKKVLVAYNSIPVFLKEFDINFTYKHIPPSRYVVYIGIYRYRKNIETIIRALYYSSDINLVLVGSVISQKDYLLEYAKKYNVGDRIIFTGIVSEENKKEIIQKSIALVMSSDYEGFGFPVIEAQSFSVPVICSDIPVFQEIGEKSVLFFEKGNENDLAEKINLISKDTILRDSLIKKGLENILRFDWEKSVKLIINKLQSYENTSHK